MPLQDRNIPGIIGIKRKRGQTHLDVKAFLCQRKLTALQNASLSELDNDDVENDTGEVSHESYNVGEQKYDDSMLQVHLQSMFYNY